MNWNKIEIEYTERNLKKLKDILSKLNELINCIKPPKKNIAVMFNDIEDVKKKKIVIIYLPPEVIKNKSIYSLFTKDYMIEKCEKPEIDKLTFIGHYEGKVGSINEFRLIYM